MSIVVIDEAVITTLLEDIFTHEGCPVATATTLSQARSILAATPPDLILLDVSMYQAIASVLHELWSDDAKDVPIILMGTEKLQRELWEYGAVGFLPKPFELDVLMEMVHHYAQMECLYLPSYHVLADAAYSTPLKRW
jgi:DNA-binding NtrC family response regulator